jgi:23S rRNA (cytosine1962-C5)-methyltransferase
MKYINEWNYFDPNPEVIITKLTDEILESYQKNVADSWMIKYHIDSIDKTIDFRLALTSFKHVGVFPEQAVNWEYIGEGLKKIKNDKKNFLNLFAYTGGASLTAKAAGADTTHVDSIKQVVTWANSNMEISKLNHIRWVVEDALKFVKREVKRGNTYHGIILDPPAYGHGPNGEKWKLEDNINEMIQLVLQLLNPQEHFLILNAYSLGFSGIILENLLNTHLSKFPKAKIETGELFLQSTHKNKLPLGVFGRVELFK